ncbi:MAG TPA: elongation factor P [Phycisphaerae bacterium]|nr:elongation factor P [Phycisphaerae bacterium]HPS52553.1 elongation factor P [Phycisphaerae bacterium]
MAKKVNDFKKGQGCIWKNNEIWVFLKMEWVKPGKGPSYIQAELRNAKTGQIVANRFRPEETLEPVHFDIKKYEYLYTDANSHILMDPETYDQIELPLDVIGDNKVYLTENCEIEVCSVDGKYISAELPYTVELKIVDCPPNVKGGTVTNVLKEAVCEGGAKIRVPGFVEVGEMIKVDTRTGEYLGRV